MKEIFHKKTEKNDLFREADIETTHLCLLAINDGQRKYISPKELFKKNYLRWNPMMMHIRLVFIRRRKHKHIVCHLGD